MKRFKKRTIALVLASVITVAGSFAAENYKNSLMSLKFDNAADGGISMSVETKTEYTGNITPVRRDANTYTLTLSEMNSKINGMPNLEKVSSDISSVEIKTLPYTNNAKGYTRIVIKTHNPVNIKSENKVYIPSKDDITAQIPDNSSNENRNAERKNRTEQEQAEKEQRKAERLQREQEARARAERDLAENNPQTDSTKSSVNNSEYKASTPIVNDTSFTTEAEKDPFHVLMTVLAILAIAGIIAYCVVRASNKIQEVTGEKLDIDTTDDKDLVFQKKSKRKQIKNTIKKLDDTYSKTAVRTQLTAVTNTPAKTVKPAEELNVVDLDELFKEQQEKTSQKDIIVDIDANTEDEHDALAEFLSGFSFNENDEEVKQEEKLTGYDEEFYNKIIKSNNIKFSQDDIDCMRQLLDAEVNNETIKNIADYATNTIKVELPSKEKFLENLITTYKIAQDITFTADDISTLKKLINVEIDNDFLTDLKTNPERTKEMQREIEASRNKTRKPSEILTLSVKDMLPDLSEALRKQGGRKIESEVKPITVYASEGYEVSTISIKDQLPDLSVEIDNEAAYVSKASADWELVDNSYEVETLSLSEALPDLEDALKNPEKYEKSEVKSVKADEDTLLKNISNVQFKPFYDGSESFEILNDLEVPSINDIQNEFKQFGNFEINREEEFSEPTNDNYDDFQSLYSDRHFDLDKIQAEQKAKTGLQPELELSEEENKKNHNELKLQSQKQDELIPQKIERKRDENIIASKRVRTQISEDILRKIQQTKAERIERQEKFAQRKAQVSFNNKEEKAVTQSEIKCIIDGETYIIISTTEFSEGKGCHLAKKDGGYVVFGFVGNKFIKLKEFENLKSERITARLSETLPDNISRYIVRIGMTKFIVNVTENNIEYLMALS